MLQYAAAYEETSTSDDARHTRQTHHLRRDRIRGDRLPHGRAEAAAVSLGLPYAFLREDRRVEYGIHCNLPVVIFYVGFCF